MDSTKLKCRRCGRGLKALKSVQAGIGPTCATKERFEANSKGAEQEQLTFRPHAGEAVIDNPPESPDGVRLAAVVVRRDGEGRPVTNVPRLVTLHSPDGFEFGYGGSGPADLALNILMAFSVPRQVAERMHQDFKWEFVAKLDQEKGGIIQAVDIMRWIDAHVDAAVAPDFEGSPHA